MLNVSVTGSSKLAIKTLQQTPAAIQGAMQRGLARGLLSAVATSQLKYLSGPRAARLDAISGRLRQNVASEVENDGATIIGRFGDNVPYAAFHEFGFHGVVNVKAHVRVIGQVSDLGEIIDTRRRVVKDTGEFVGFLDSRKRSASKQENGLIGVSFVKAHSRTVNYAGRPFLRPALEESMDAITTEISAEIKTLHG